MRIYLVVGNNSSSLKEVMEKDNSITVAFCDNTLKEAFDNIVENDVEFDTLLLMDQGIGDSLESFAKIIFDFRELVDNLIPDIQFKFVTKEPEYKEIFDRTSESHPRFNSYLADAVKIPVALLKEICLKPVNSFYEDTVLLSDATQPPVKNLWASFQKQSNPATDIPGELRKEGSRLDTPEAKGIKETRSIKEVKSTKDAKSFKESSEVKGIQKNSYSYQGSRSVNRVIAFTGHRGAGATSTVSNIAVLSGNEGLKTIVIDLDLLNRGINLYFDKFGKETDLDSELAFSLIRCMLKPNQYYENTCIINDNLCVTTLAYSVESTDKALEQINSKKLISMISMLKSSFDLVLLDIPMEYFKKYPDLVLHLDSIGICISNSLYSILNTVKSADTSIHQEELLLFKMKSKLVFTKYNSSNTHNGKKLTMDYCKKLLSEVGEAFDNSIQYAGFIPHSPDFDRQVDTRKKLSCTNNEYREYYSTVLDSLI